MKTNMLLDKSEDFALRIIGCYQFLKDHEIYVISKQLLRSGTSIGANISESIYAQTDPDFITKLSIALKEASETGYWLRLLHRKHLLEESAFNSLYNDVEELIKILSSTIISKKENMKNEKNDQASS